MEGGLKKWDAYASYSKTDVFGLYSLHFYSSAVTAAAEAAAVAAVTE